MEPKPGIVSISIERDYALVTARFERINPAEERERFLDRIASQNISVELLQFTPSGAVFACAASKGARVLAIADDAGANATLVSPCSKIAATGTEIPRVPGIASGILRAVREAGSSVQHFGDGGSTLGVLVAQHESTRAQAAVTAFLQPWLHAEAPSFTLDELRGILRVDGRDVRLGARQLALLRYLIEHAGRAVSAESIAHALLGNSEKHVAAVRVHVHNLRRKIERDPDAPRYVITVPSRGYSFAR